MTLVFILSSTQPTGRHPSRAAEAIPNTCLRVRLASPRGRPSAQHGSCVHVICDRNLQFVRVPRQSSRLCPFPDKLQSASNLTKHTQERDPYIIREHAQLSARRGDLRDITPREACRTSDNPITTCKSANAHPVENLKHPPQDGWSRHNKTQEHQFNSVIALAEFL